MTDLTRRAALAAPLALGLPVAAFAVPNSGERKGVDDPAVAAFAAWRAAFMDFSNACDEGQPEEVTDAACDVTAETLSALGAVQATTLEGARGQILAAIYAVGNAVRGLPNDPLDWRPCHYRGTGYPMDDAGVPALWSALRVLDRMRNSI